MNKEQLLSYNKEDLYNVSLTLNEEDIAQLIEWLNEKDDTRYYSMLLLKNRIEYKDDVFKYWNELVDKLDNENSYQRSVGILLLSELVKWDKENKIDEAIDKFLSLCEDEKPITSRQCIQSLTNIFTHKPKLADKIIAKLISVNYSVVQPNMRKLIVLDILNVLKYISKEVNDVRIDRYFNDILDDGDFDEKTKKVFKGIIEE